MEVAISGKITGQFSPTQFHLSLPGSRVVEDVRVPGGKCGNVQTGWGDRVSTVSQLGCSTSVALAMGPTDEEEEEENLIHNKK